MNKQSILVAIQAHSPILMDTTPHSAAVLVLLMEDQHKLFLVLTKRAQTLANYAGDYAFPGGMRDMTDADLKITVQREVREELNLTPTCYEIVGQLDDFHDRFGNLVRPYVATITKKEFESHYKKSDAEVANIYYFSLDDIVKIKPNVNLEKITKRHPTYVYEQDDVIVWGLTASIIVHLGNIIFGSNKMVGKYLVEN
ncbi:MAG: NUDIX hydrolase [Gammaproteobacteria bacterium]